MCCPQCDYSLCVIYPDSKLTAWVCPAAHLRCSSSLSYPMPSSTNTEGDCPPHVCVPMPEPALTTWCIQRPFLLEGCSSSANKVLPWWPKANAVLVSGAKRRTAETQHKRISASGSLRWQQLRRQLTGGHHCRLTWRLPITLHHTRYSIGLLEAEK